MSASPVDTVAQAGTDSGATPDVPDVSATDLPNGITILRDAVARLESPETEPLARISALDSIAEVIDGQLWQRYRARHIGLSLPLSKDAQQLTDALIDLHQLMAQSYRCELVYLMAEALSRDVAMDLPLKAAYGANLHLIRILLVAYESYRAEPTGIWTEIHEIYEHACSLGIDESVIPGTNGLTVTKTYKHAVLLGLSNPYHLAFGVIGKIDRALPVWIDKANLSTSPSFRPDRCVFLIDAAFDAPAVPLLSNSAVPKARGVLFLDTTDLAAELRQQMNSLVYQTTWHKHLRLHSFSNFERLKILRSLVGRWASHRIRSSRRIKRAAWCDLAIGMNSVTYAVNTSAPSEPPNQPSDIVLSKEVIRGTFSLQLARQRDLVRLSRHWQICDVSRHGCRLRLADPDQSRVQVNELVALRPRDESERWMTGLIQWARSDKGGTLEVGVRALSRYARPISISWFSPSEQTTQRHGLALLLSRSAKPNASIIVPSGMFNPELVFMAHLHQGERRIYFKRLIMTTPSFDWFEIQPFFPAEFGQTPSKEYAATPADDKEDIARTS